MLWTNESRKKHEPDADKFHTVRCKSVHGRILTVKPWTATQVQDATFGRN